MTYFLRSAQGVGVIFNFPPPQSQGLSPHTLLPFVILFILAKGPRKNNFPFCRKCPALPHGNSLALHLCTEGPGQQGKIHCASHKKFILFVVRSCKAGALPLLVFFIMKFSHCTCVPTVPVPLGESSRSPHKTCIVGRGAVQLHFLR